jgi:L-asparaginase
MPGGSDGAARVGLMVIPGTIDALEIEGSRRQPGMLASARVAAGAIVATIQRLASLPELVILTGSERLSHELENGDWIDVAQRIQDALDQELVDALVVTHGTNNLEELAYFLSLTVRSDKPVVITGAMLPWNSAGADGRWNLINAIHIAASPMSRRRGVIVAFGRDVFESRSLTKVSTHALSAFAAPGGGAIGRLDGDVVRYNRPPQQRSSWSPPIALLEASKMPRVDIIVSYVGADGAVIESCVASGAAGLVTMGGGGGIVTPQEHAALLRATAGGVIICQASRVSGGVAQLTNERLDSGFVAAGDLSPWKARILLMLALTQSRDVSRIREFFVDDFRENERRLLDAIVED